MNPVYFTTNAEYGVSALVYRSSGGKFSVALRDMEAEETAPYLRIFPSQSAAEEYARSLVSR